MSQFNNLADILNHEFIGNHASDNSAFVGIEKFCQRDDVPMTDKIKAIKHQATKGMGLDPLPDTEYRKYVKSLIISGEMKNNKHNKRPE